MTQPASLSRRQFLKLAGVAGVGAGLAAACKPNACHILTHAESAHGMFGMVTAVVVK